MQSAAECRAERKGKSGPKVKVHCSLPLSDKVSQLSWDDSLGFHIATFDQDCRLIRRRIKIEVRIHLDQLDELQQCLANGTQSQIDSLSKFCRLTNESSMLQQLLFKWLIRRRLTGVSKEYSRMEEIWHDHVADFKVEHVQRAWLKGQFIPAARITVTLDLDFDSEFGTQDSIDHESKKRRFCEVFASMMSAKMNVSRESVLTESLSKGSIIIGLLVFLGASSVVFMIADVLEKGLNSALQCISKYVDRTDSNGEVKGHWPEKGDYVDIQMDKSVERAIIQDFDHESSSIRVKYSSKSICVNGESKDRYLITDQAIIRILGNIDHRIKGQTIDEFIQDFSGIPKRRRRRFTVKV